MKIMYNRKQVIFVVINVEREEKASLLFFLFLDLFSENMKKYGQNVHNTIK